jgi:hypothetical protein
VRRPLCERGPHGSAEPDELVQAGKELAGEVRPARSAIGNDFRLTTTNKHHNMKTKLTTDTILDAAPVLRRLQARYNELVTANIDVEKDGTIKFWLAVGELSDNSRRFIYGDSFEDAEQKAYAELVDRSPESLKAKRIAALKAELDALTAPVEDKNQIKMPV